MTSSATELRRLLTLERNQGKEQIRWSWDEYQPPNGRVARYVHVRKWILTSDGDWLPTKAGITIRLGELAQVVASLTKVLTAWERQKGNGVA